MGSSSAGLRPKTVHPSSQVPAGLPGRAVGLGPGLPSRQPLPLAAPWGEHLQPLTIGKHDRVDVTQKGQVQGQPHPVRGFGGW